MIQAPGALFLGTLVADEQKYVKVILENALKAGYNRVVEPCSGALAMSHLAVQAGFKPNQIEASDVSLFSSVMGYAMMEKPLDDLNIRATGFTDDEMRDYATALYAIRYMKTMMQAGNEIIFNMLRDLEYNKEKHIAKLKEQIDRGRGILKGFLYRPLCIFDHINEVANDEKTIIIANPPTYTRGFEKWYDTGNNITWKEPTYRMFDPNCSLDDMYDTMNDAKALLICYEEKPSGQYTGKAIFSRAYSRKGIHVYLTSNREGEAEALANGKMVVRRSESDMEPLECSMLPTDYEITENSKIEVMRVEQKNSQYYRSMWTHNFVGSISQINMAIFIDRYIAGVFGYQTAIGKKLKDLLLVYGMTIPHRESRLNRLLTMIACNKSTLKMVLTDYDVSRFGKLISAQMTKYPESKEMRGIMKLAKKKKDPKAGYRLVYESAIHDRSNSETLIEWLKKEQTWKKERTKAKEQSIRTA